MKQTNATASTTIEVQLNTKQVRHQWLAKLLLNDGNISEGNFREGRVRTLTAEGKAVKAGLVTAVAKMRVGHLTLTPEQDALLLHIATATTPNWNTFHVITSTNAALAAALETASISNTAYEALYQA